MAWEYEARHTIEALRSGIPSRAIGRHFSEARADLLASINETLDRVVETQKSEAAVISGKYGEGKTHLLNTVWELANRRNMVVSMVSLSKETPLDKLHILYPKLVANTYLPNHTQPGFTQELSRLSANSVLLQHLLLYTQNRLETNRLYYHLSCLVKSDDPEEQYLLETDLMGDFIPNHQINRIYRRITGEKAQFNKPFAKTKNALDYYHFLSHLFLRLGYAGWVILFDESELIGRYGKKARQKTYLAMDHFLDPSESLKGVFSLFAFSSSFTADVIEQKGEYETAIESFPDDAEVIHKTLDAIVQAKQLEPLSTKEIHRILEGIITFHARAYDWNPMIDPKLLIRKIEESGGYLLRSKIRSAIEYLDQLYLYHSEGTTTLTALQEETYEIPTYEELFEGE